VTSEHFDNMELYLNGQPLPSLQKNKGKKERKKGIVLE
jgi:hypothetical protein